METQLSFFGTQLPLSGLPEPARPPERDGRQRRDDGTAAALAHAEDADPGWGAWADAVLLAWCRSHPTVHVDDLTPLLALRQPPHHNAIGGIWLRARKRGVIVRTGETRPARVGDQKHYRQTPIYRSTVYQGTEHGEAA